MFSSWVAQGLVRDIAVYVVVLWRFWRNLFAWPFQFMRWPGCFQSSHVRKILRAPVAKQCKPHLSWALSWMNLAFSCWPCWKILLVCVRAKSCLSHYRPSNLWSITGFSLLMTAFACYADAVGSCVTRISSASCFVTCCIRLDFSWYLFLLFCSRC